MRSPPSPRRAPGHCEGATGARGPTGPAGSTGTANIRWALVAADATVVSKSDANISLTSHSPGNYILNFGSATTGKPVLASGAYAGDSSDQRGAVTASPCGGGSEGRTCPTGFDTTSHVFIQTRNDAGLPADHAFYVAVFG